MEWRPSSLSSSDAVYLAGKYLTSSAKDKDIICGHLFSEFQVFPSYCTKFLHEVSSTSVLYTDSDKFYVKEISEYSKDVNIHFPTFTFWNWLATHKKQPWVALEKPYS